MSAQQDLHISESDLTSTPIKDGDDVTPTDPRPTSQRVDATADEYVIESEVQDIDSG